MIKSEALFKKAQIALVQKFYDDFYKAGPRIRPMHHKLHKWAGPFASIEREGLCPIGAPGPPSMRAVHAALFRTVDPKQTVHPLDPVHHVIRGPHSSV